MNRILPLVVTLVFAAPLVLAQSNMMVFEPLEGDDAGILTVRNGELDDEDVRPDIGTCNPTTLGACCIYTDCIGTMEEEPCLDLGGSWYEGEDCDDFICPSDCEYALYDNGYPTDDDPYPSQCDTEYPMQVEVCDDFILQDTGPIEVSSIVAWMGFWDHDPVATPADLDALIFDVYNDDGTGNAPGGNPVDMDPDCARQGDIVWTHEYAQGEFGYLLEPNGAWRIWVPLDPGELILYPGMKYWIGWAGRHFFSTMGQGGPTATDQLTGSPCLLYFPLLGYNQWTDVWGQDIAFCINGIPSFYTYFPGDCNFNWIALELDDVITMIGTYRGTIENPYTLLCPPHGDNFPATADPNGNCVANEIDDVVTEIAAYRGMGDVYGCPDCPGHRRLLPGDEDQPLIAPSLKTKIKIENGSARE